MSKKYVDLETLKYILYDIHKLENLLSIRKKELGIRGENFNILDLIREAIAFYVKYKKVILSVIHQN